MSGDRVGALVLLALLWCAGPAALADELFVRNRPFRGPVSGSGERIEAGLQQLAEAVGLKVEGVNGGFYLPGPGRRSEDARQLVTGAGVVVVGGKVVASRTDAEGQVLVPVREFARALGLLFTANPSLGTVDLALPPDWGRDRAEGGGPAVGSQSVPAAGFIPPIEVPTNAGQNVVNVDDFLVRGRLNFVYFYGGNKISADTTPCLAPFARKHEGVAVIMVNLGSLDTPMARRYHDIPQLPVVMVLGPNLRCFTVYPRHSAKRLFESEAEFEKVREQSRGR